MLKYLCENCGWVGKESLVLRAENPFAEDAGETMMGCPQCREPNRLRLACDVPDCEREATCGTATPAGYRRTCSKHQPSA